MPPRRTSLRNFAPSRSSELSMPSRSPSQLDPDADADAEAQTPSSSRRKRARGVDAEDESDDEVDSDAESGGSFTVSEQRKSKRKGMAKAEVGARTAEIPDGNPSARAKRQRVAASSSSAPPPLNSSDGQLARAGASSSAHELYYSAEIRELVFSWLDNNSLAAMMRVEKGVTAAAARFLYHTIPSNILSRMSRAKGRRVVYCDAVRVIDQTYIYQPPTRNMAAAWRPRESLTRFSAQDAEALVGAVKTYLKKCPNLARVEHEYPSNTCAPRYVLHVSDDGRMELDLHEHIVMRDSLLVKGQFCPPDLPAFSDIDTVRHTITLCMASGVTDDAGETTYISFDETSPWREWLCRPQWDPRVTGLSSWGGSQPFYSWRDIDKDVRSAAVIRAEQGGCSALRQLHLGHSVSVSLDSPGRLAFTHWISVLGRSLLSLDLFLVKRGDDDDDDDGSGDGAKDSYRDLGDLFLLLQQHAPNISTLQLRVNGDHLSEESLQYLEDRIPASNFSLRRFELSTTKRYLRKVDIPRVRYARAMRRFGSRQCFYACNPNDFKSLEAKEKFASFNRYIKLMDSSGAVGQAMRQGHHGTAEANLAAHFGGTGGALFDSTKKRKELAKYLDDELLARADAMAQKAHDVFQDYANATRDWAGALHSMRAALVASEQLQINGGAGTLEPESGLDAQAVRTRTLRDMGEAWESIRRARELFGKYHWDRGPMLVMDGIRGLAGPVARRAEWVTEATRGVDVRDQGTDGAGADGG